MRPVVIDANLKGTPKSLQHGKSTMILPRCLCSNLRVWTEKSFVGCVPKPVRPFSPLGEPLKASLQRWMVKILQSLNALNALSGTTDFNRRHWLWLWKNDCWFSVSFGSGKSQTAKSAARPRPGARSGVVMVRVLQEQRASIHQRLENHGSE